MITLFKTNSKLYVLIGFFFLNVGLIHSQGAKTTITGELKKWHKVTLSFEGEALSENDEDNPFLNYRLNVIFKHKNKVITVPGFYAADGSAGETSGKSGKIWKVRFMPDEVGEWAYEVFFRKGKNIAISDAMYAGEPTAFNGAKGTFNIVEADKTGSGFQIKGRLQYTGERYLRYADTKEAFLKGGADSPENFLGYYEFDQTPPSHKYEAHAQDYKSGDPAWQNGKGKNIIGALNYLASKGMNSVYFLTMNVQGDGKDVWPWTDENERYRFDCSKLDQWEIVFDHMDNLGLMLHIVTQETENELLLDIGELKTQRKLYYRELIARFSHHLGVTWNLGEENGWQKWTPKAQTDDDRKAMARYLKTHDPYKNLVVLHTHAATHAQDLFLTPLLGFQYLDGPSMQTHHPHDVHDITAKWIEESGNFGHQWVVSQDEIGPADTGAKPDKDDPEHNGIRAEVLWGNLMAGGAGVEWYFGYKYAHNDLNCEDWRSRDVLWDQTRYALAFFNTYIPFEKMIAQDDLTDNTLDYVLADEGHAYAIYFPKVEAVQLDLSGYKGKFSVKWYNPRTGGNLHYGSKKTIKGGAKIAIGFPPSKEGDWVAVVQNKIRNNTKIATTEGIVLNALSDFEIDESADVVYYKEANRATVAINAAKKNQRGKFAAAKTIFKGKTGMYYGVLHAVAEHDGESVYILKINNDKVKTVATPEVDESFKSVKLPLGAIYLKTNDTIIMSSKAHSNGKIPEDDETAWSRGRWKSLELHKNKILKNRGLEDAKAFEETNSVFEIEAENYHLNSNNGSLRKWYKRVNNDNHSFASDNQTNTASNNSYIEAYPDSRVTHQHDLIQGENFFPVPGMGGMVGYKVNIKKPGKYRVWVKAFSTGSEDNGLHVGLDGQWPESGQRIQLCEGKHKWTWTSAQRVPENHCGIPKTIYLDIEEAGAHIITFSMREDGFKFDTFILTSDLEYAPE
ncbi:DUF5060 domain-containing protein [Algibacter sp. 2305UL17-15]|uniref:DUF5060 domain-containing protein n=1 Tax=Algibacter sp. 2305UL17-15 TaxID=3231268 RepID=UPI0034580EAE